MAVTRGMKMVLMALENLGKGSHPLLPDIEWTRKQKVEMWLNQHFPQFEETDRVPDSVIDSSCCEEKMSHNGNEDDNGDEDDNNENGKDDDTSDDIDHDDGDHDDGGGDLDEDSMMDEDYVPCVESASTDSADSEIIPQLETQADQSQEQARITERMGQTTGNKKGKPKRPCLYCQQFVSQLPRHLFRKHKDVDEVKAAAALSPPERRRAIDQIRKQGIFRLNLKLKAEGKSLIRERNQGPIDTEVVVCNGCKGFFKKRRISKHKKLCVASKGINTGYLHVNFLGEGNADQFQREVLQRFRNDDSGIICQTDPTVIKLGKKLWAKSARKEKSVIMNEMRTFGNLILEVRKVAHNDDLKGEDIIRRDNFEYLQKAIENMTHKDGVLKAGLKLSIGYLLKKIIKVMKGSLIQQNDLEGAVEVDRFAALLDLNWEFIFYTAQLACERRRQNLRKPSDMPLEKDLASFRNFIVEETQKMTSDTYHKWDKHDFVYIRNLLVSRLTLFNARRGGEPARMLMSDWAEAEKGSWIDKQLVEGVDDPLEKELIDSMKLAYQSGKGSKRLVPVLFPQDTLKPLRKLIAEREDCGVLPDNHFLFPNTGMSNDHVIGWHSIQSVAKVMGNKLESPNLIIADRFRHRASTLFALLEVPRERREIFYRHMGHTENINRDVYQCPLAIREITEVGGFLNKLDKETNETSMDDPDNREQEDSGQSHNMTIPEKVPTFHRNKKSEGCNEIQTGKKSAEDMQNWHTCSTQSNRRRSKHSLFEKEDTDIRDAQSNGKKSKTVPADNLSNFDAHENLSDCCRTSTESEKDNTEGFRGERHSQPHVVRLTAGTKSRKYRRWTPEDSEKVTSFFHSYTNDMSCLTKSKGSLPSKKEVLVFLSSNHVFENKAITEKEKISLIKTKVFNERKKNREKASKEFHSL